MLGGQLLYSYGALMLHRKEFSFMLIGFELGLVFKLGSDFVEFSIVIRSKLVVSLSESIILVSSSTWIHDF